MSVGLSIYKETEDKMKSSIEVLKSDLNNIRAGRANPSLLEQIVVEYYGTMTPINQVASISAPEPRLLVIQPWDATIIPAIEKSILQSDLGLNPSNDGKLIRLPIPALTEERRKDLVKIVKQSGEDTKIAIRNIRRDSNDEVKKLEKNKELSEDEKKIAEEKIQKTTDTYTAKVDEIISAKESELMEI